MNVIRNTVGIFVFAIIIMLFMLVFSISNTLTSSLYTNINASYSNLNVNTSMISSFKSSIDWANELLISGIDFLVMFVMTLTIFSSFISRNTITEYVSLFIVNLMLSSIIIYAFHMIYNTFVVAASSVSIIDLDIFSDFLFTNFDYLILLNSIAFLCSFVFKKIST